ncbi:hypothetical protein BD324DRAFT_660481 [Kockovaella imperatae]|uniref:Peptide hydrolase n=1 Tax=Kockovaella imperatae TaxID=4999 RepID=A0A1Y1UDL5_9TREE|nr:hypothetical protein BD324DRAFT_660481 [Kockovaella imperatae]ORX35606.1 hypothetical protein BD324DRAFT_660481 [Kockovaella imperatae]
MSRRVKPSGGNDSAIKVNVTSTSASSDPKEDEGVYAGQDYRTSLTTRIFIFLLTALPWYLYRAHYKLPEPLGPVPAHRPILRDFLDVPRPSEEIVLSHIAALENIGYRIVGLEQARRGEQYVIDQVRLLEDRCKADGVLDCKVYIQEGSGFHMFNILDHDILKVYTGVRNVILEIRAKHPTSGRRVEKDGILLASHIDSTLPSKGAADDAMGVGVMLDIARVVIDRKRPFDNSLLFVWNGAEETLQDGSHLYATQHETAKEIRTMINLEAAGSTGGALVFQATSKEMIDVFSKFPYPRGSVIAADIFASGILLSDTDFGQFERYLNISGLDMAIIGHSYFYHTQKDLLVHIERGSAQHFSENVMTAVEYLTSPASPILHSEEWSPPSMVYLTMYDKIFQSWSMETATPVYIGFIASLATVMTLSSVNFRAWKPVVAALVGTPLALVFSAISANTIAYIMSSRGHGLSWFKHEHICLFLYVPPALFGYLGSQYMLNKFLVPDRPADLDRLYYLANLMVNTWTMLILQSIQIRSAYVFAVLSGVLLIGLFTNTFYTRRSSRDSLLGLFEAYAPTLFLCMILGVEGLTTVLDTFVPLTGRIGKDAPAEYIVATICSTTVPLFYPIISPIFHRLSRPQQLRTLKALGITTLLAMGFFAGRWWRTYDYMHPKRTATQYVYNHTSGEHTCHVGFMDRGPRLDFVQSLHSRYGAPGSQIKATTITKNDTDWDVLYPVSSFLETYKFDLPAVPFDWPKPSIDVKELDHIGGVRRLLIHLDFTGIVWPTLAFEAEVVDWSYKFEPPTGNRRHHLKIATSVDTPTVDLELDIRARKGDKIKFEWTGIDMKQMVPQTAADLGPNMPASRMLLDFRPWAEEHFRGAVDLFMYGAVTGMVEV